MTDIITQEARPLDKRCREAHPESLVIGGEVMERNDVTAARLTSTERTVNRGDREGAPYLYIAGIKYRPRERYDAWFLTRIQARKPKRRAP